MVLKVVESKRNVENWAAKAESKPRLLAVDSVSDASLYGESGNDVILIKYLDGRRRALEAQDSQAKDPAVGEEQSREGSSG